MGFTSHKEIREIGKFQFFLKRDVYEKDILEIEGVPVLSVSI